MTHLDSNGIGASRSAGRDGAPVAPDLPHWRLWGTLGWGVLIAVAFVLIQTGVAIVAVAATGEGLSEAEIERRFLSADDGTLIALATCVTGVLGFALIAGIIKLKRGSSLPDYLALRSVPPKALLKWIGWLLVFLILSDVGARALDRPVVPDFVRNVYTTAEPVWLLWVALVIAAPLFEETFVRGFLFRGFASSFLKPAGAVFVTAALWTVVHLQYESYELASVFGLGLLLGAARVSTGSLLTPLAMHAAANLLAVSMAALVT